MFNNIISQNVCIPQIKTEQHTERIGELRMQKRPMEKSATYVFSMAVNKNESNAIKTIRLSFVAGVPAHCAQERTQFVIQTFAC